MRTVLVLPYMLGLYVISFSTSMFLLLFFCLNFQQKKNGGEDAEFYFFLLIAFQILHVFLPDILVHCALIKNTFI
jgi:hypothetical protein